MGRRAAGHRSVAQPPAPATLRRRTATRRTRAGNGPGTRSLPAGRAAVQPRRQTTSERSRRAQAISAARRDYDDLCDARPVGGDGPRRSDCGDGAGRVRQLAPPVEVYDDPSDTFVATFLGSPPMNLVPRDGHLVGFRPEHLLPEDVVPGENKIRVPFTVDRIEHLSGDRHLYGTVHRLGEETRVITRLPATVTLPVGAWRRAHVRRCRGPTAVLRCGHW